MKVILASGSPRRKVLLKLIVPKFEVITSQIDEQIEEKLTPEEKASKLANMKAKDVFSNTSGDRVVIGSDTIVAKEGKVYGKPKNNENAKQIIKELLRGDKTHEVITGLSVIIEKDSKIKEYNTYDKAKIYLKDMTDDEIEKWINTGKASDKAGAYAIQEEFCVFVEKIDGNYTTIVGLPTHKLYDILKINGIFN